MPEKRIFAKAGHVCMMCGFKATTKNKYRELQDHLVRRHFQDRIKAALPTRRPFMCPDHSCNVEGKDWQALMRHYTGKHGVLEAYLKEFLASQMEYKENLHFKSLPPTNKIGCRRKRHKRHSSGDQDPTEAEDSTEDPPGQTLPPPPPSAIASPPLHQLPPALEPVTTLTGSTSYDSSPPTSEAASSEESQGQFQTGSPALSADSETILQLDDSDPADCPPTHLALVLKRRKVNKDGLEEDSLEETYAFVDLKYFQPLSANQYVMKSQIIDPSLLALQTTSSIQHPHLFHQQPPSQPPTQEAAADPASIPPTSSTTPIGSSQPAMAAYSANNGGCFFVDSSTHGGASQSYFESFPTQPEEAAAQYSPNSAVTVTSGSSPTPCSASTIYIPADPATFALAPRPHDPSGMETPSSSAHQPQDQCYDQVVPNHGGVTACAGEVEVSTTLVQYEDEGQPPILMEVPISNGGPVATVSIDPKGLNRGCSKVVVETVKSIPMDAGGCVTATTTEASAGGHYELMSHGMDGMKEIDFAMF